MSNHITEQVEDERDLVPCYMIEKDSITRLVSILRHSGLQFDESDWEADHTLTAFDHHGVVAVSFSVSPRVIHFVGDYIRDYFKDDENFWGAYAR